MKRLLAVLVLAGASVNSQTITTQTFGTGANAFSIEIVEIGNPGNMPDRTGFGSVNYSYSIAKYEISRAMVEKANAAGSLGVTLFDMTDYGGNLANRPATGISWNEAARFVNWLNTNQGYQAAYNFITAGVNDNISVWDTNQYSGTNQYRHKDAYYFLPSADEWYKAAYGNPSGGWHLHTTGGVGLAGAPVSVASGTAAGTTVFGQPWSTGPADVDNAGGLSPFGTMGQGGNVFEWTESAYDGSNNSSTENRDLRGGSWSNNSSYPQTAGFRWNVGVPTAEDIDFGFRVAMVPEPSSLSLLLAGGAVLMAGRRTILSRK